MFRFFKKDKKDLRTMTDVMGDVVDESVILTKKIIEYTGTDMTGMLGLMDEKSGALMGCLIQSTKKYGELFEELCAIEDRHEDKLDSLISMNENLMKQNENLMKQLASLQKA